MSTTVLTIAGNPTPQIFRAATPFGFTVVIEYADHAFGGMIERINNVSTIDWLFNIAEGLTGGGTGEVGYESSLHGFGGCLRFYDLIGGQLLERFKSVSIEVATNYAPVECESWKVSQQPTTRDKHAEVEAQMAAEYEKGWANSSLFNSAPISHRPELIRAMALGEAQNDDYPRCYQFCRADDTDAVFRAEQKLSQAEYCYWSTTVVVDGVAYFMGFEYGD